MTQYWLFLFFFQHLFQTFNQMFLQKWNSRLSKANFCSKSVATGFAVFVFLSTSFRINCIFINWCQSTIFSEMTLGILKTELLLKNNGHTIWCFRRFLNIFSNKFDQSCLMSINHFLRNEARSSQKSNFAHFVIQQLGEKYSNTSFDKVVVFEISRTWKRKFYSFCEFPVWWKTTQWPLLTELWGF